MDPTTNPHYRPADAPPTVFVLYSVPPSDYDRGTDEFLGVFATETAAHAEIVRRALDGKGIERARVESSTVQS